MKNIIESATSSDGKEMLELIESKATDGNFQLLYTRRPNAYESYLKGNQNTHIGIIRDDNGKIAMQTVCEVNDYYINGKKTTIGYVNGVRKREDYKGIINWKALSNYVKSANCDMYYCSFLIENESSMSLFTKKRKHFPQLFPVCEYTTYIINPKVLIASKKSKYTFRPIKESDLEKVYTFLNKEGARYNFAPVIYDLEKQFADLLLKDCYILEDNGVILAFGALWNQTKYKQYIVTKYAGYMSILSKLSKVTEKFGFIPIPIKNEILDFPTLTLFMSKENNQEYYKCFLNEISRVIKEKYNMFVIGINSNHPNNEVYRKIRSLKFKSNIYFVRYDNEITLDNNKYIHMECGLL
jgi:hypothetical protein